MLEILGNFKNFPKVNDIDYFSSLLEPVYLYSSLPWHSVAK